MATFKLSALAALVSFVALFAAMSAAPAQGILTYKHFPRTPADAPKTDFILQPGTQGFVDTGFPPLDKRTFTKLQDDTGLRCAIAFDFLVGSTGGTLASTITIDDGTRWKVIAAPYKAAGYLTADFWGITFKDVPAGPHQIYIELAGTPGTFYSRYALLQCYEETLGIEQE